MAILQGDSIIWGVSTTAMSGYTAAVGDCTFTGEDFSEEASSVELKDEAGITRSIYWYDYKWKLSLTCYPSGSSADPENLPQNGEKVTITSTDTNFNGDWICTGVSKSRKVDGVVEFKIELSSWEGITPA